MNALVAVNPAVPAFGMNDIRQIALAIAEGGLFGSRDPNAVLTLCLLAQAEGQHPAVVFRDYHIIQGKPAKKADAMLRDFITSGGKVEWHELTDEKADATFTHPSGSARIDWTLERARAAGIANPMWKKYPRQMLRSRVISEGVRTVFPGATSGLYEEAEVRDIVENNPARINDETPPMIEHQPEAVLEEAPPKKRVQLDGPYKSKTALWTAVRAFVHSVNGIGDLGELLGYLDTPDVKELLEQCERDAPGLLRDGLPDVPEYVPLEIVIDQRKRDLEQIEDIHNTRTVLDAG
jgi:hypothetical protein